MNLLPPPWRSGATGCTEHVGPMRFVSRLLLCTAVLAAPVTAAAADFSVAEQKVFLDPQLRNVAGSATLVYDFRASGSADDNYDDRVRVTVRPGSGAGKTVSVDYLSGAHHLSLPEVTDAVSNPVILYFLEMDVREMHRLLGGQEAYFRRRIRLALANDATVSTVRVALGGRTIEASEVRIEPYLGDPLKERLGRFERKSYIFTLSPGVPGGVYQLRTEVGASAVAGSAPAVEEALTFNRTGA